ncbi:glycosyltransferase family 2 protein [Arenibaculum pallidiluteum]|uniref:glycosyltransferase family 2 protein n=1 Tax=Arenibaculum pallidiluteum TaxID=2812559 RepID=UPI001A958402|nr:glycosyltransferase [Arenibaculum pallidiluteum]
MTDLRPAVEALNAGTPQTAAAIARSVLAGRPGDPAALQVLGAASLALGDTASAVDALSALAAARPADPVAGCNLGLALRAHGDDAGAEKVLERATALPGARAEAWFELGMLRLAAGRPAAARACFDAVKDHPRLGAEAAENAAHCRRFGDPLPSPAAAAPLVSVVIPCFNHGAFVEEAVNSALEQGYRNVEVVVVEGGSTDGTSAEAVRRLSHSRVRTLFRTAPTPAGDNRNHGIAAARGKYVCCLDADDRLAPDCLEKAVFWLEELGYDIVGFGAQEFGGGARRRNFKRNPTTADLLAANEFVISAVHRRTLWQRSGGFVDFDRSAGLVHEDWNYWLRLMALGARAANLTWERLALVRNHEGARQSLDPAHLPKAEQIAIMRAANRDVLPGA